MVFVDPQILEQLEKNSEQPVPVVISCQDDCQSMVSALEKIGIRIVDSESKIFGIFSAEIISDQVEILKKQPGVTAIEYDEEAGIFD